MVCNSPRSCFQEAFHNGLVEYEDFWLKIASDRNYTAHTYKEALAEKVYADLPKALECFKQLLESIKNNKAISNKQ